MKKIFYIFFILQLNSAFAQFETNKLICAEEVNTHLIDKKFSYKNEEGNNKYVIEAFHYDSIGRIVFIKTLHKKQLLKQINYEYSGTNLKSSQIEYFDLDTSKVSNLHKIKEEKIYNSLGNIVEEYKTTQYTDATNYKTVAKYNYSENGNVNSITYQKIEDNDQKVTFRIDSNIYDLDGRLEKYIYINQDNQIWETRNYTFNKKGQLNRIETYQGKSEMIIDSLFYNNSCLTKWANYKSDGTELGYSEYHYDKSGLLVRISFHSFGELLSERLYEYNEYGHIIKDTLIDSEEDTSDILNYLIEYK